MKAETIIKNEFARRTALINDPAFMEAAVEAAKALGITADEWNENRAMISMMFANEFCKIENAQA